MKIQHVSVLVAASAAMFLGGTASAQDAAKLAQEKACLACHAVDKKVVGPSYKEIAAKYKADKGAEANLAKKIRAGSVGVFGQVPMPPNTTVSEKEAQILAKWIMSQK
ncbi:MAG: c-type cytochrome [Betaproteobacteria bacterium]|nr:c-type cytochrome [Betaproteobacteria bacterium]